MVTGAPSEEFTLNHGVPDLTLEILEKLISMDTTSHRSNLECIHWISDYLGRYGISVSLSHGPSPEKANLFATIGPPDRGGIVLSGHTDVVPADPSGWQSNPFELTQRGSRLYGRGTCDMKGFLAVVLASILEMVAQPLRCPFHIAFSFDEELGCRGVRHLIEALPQDGRRPKVALIGEPTRWQLVDRHKGSCLIATTIKGKAAHSSRPELGVNAIEVAAQLINRISGVAAERQSPAIEPGLRTVFNFGRIAGGTADNIVADTCTFSWGFRTFEEDSRGIIATVRDFAEQSLLPAMRETAPDSGFEFVIEREVPALNVDAASLPFVELLQRWSDATSPPSYVGFGTEAGHYARAGIPSLVCGPGDIAQAHQTDEWVEIDQLKKGNRLMQNAIAWARTHIPDDLLARPR